MADYKIPIDTFIRETFECMASVCAIFSGAALSFQNTRMHTRRNSTDLQIMAGSTLLTIPLNSIDHFCSSHEANRFSVFL